MEDNTEYKCECEMEGCGVIRVTAQRERLH